MANSRLHGQWLDLDRINVQTYFTREGHSLHTDPEGREPLSPLGSRGADVLLRTVTGDAPVRRSVASARFVDIFELLREGRVDLKSPKGTFVIPSSRWWNPCLEG